MWADMSGIDCGLETDGKKFRYRSAAIIIEDGKMLLMENNRDPFLYTVGGAVKIGETAEEAVRRECLEETGVCYEPERLAVIQEEFYREPARDGSMLESHELGFFYVMRPRGTAEGVLERSTTDGFEERTRWIPLNELGRYTIIPPFVKDPENYSGPLRHTVAQLA